MGVVGRRGASTVRSGVSRGRPAGSRLPRRLLSTLAMMALALATASCTATSAGVGSPESPCFLALPAAKSAVHGRGHFSGVRYLTGDQLATALRSGPAGRRAVPAVLDAQRASGICAVAYRGRYRRGGVVQSWPTGGRRVSRIAVVVVRQKDGTVLVTMLFEREPIGFVRVFPSLGKTPSLHLR